MPASRQATGVAFPCAIDTSIWRSSVTICSALNLLFGMASSFPSSFSHTAWSENAPSGHDLAQIGPLAGSSIEHFEKEEFVDNEKQKYCADNQPHDSKASHASRTLQLAIRAPAVASELDECASPLLIEKILQQYFRLCKRGESKSIMPTMIIPRFQTSLLNN